MPDTVPPLYSLESCDTVLNEARRLFSDGRFPVHASVIAARQTEGRGQHGHRWVSPVGNLYAAIRLPLSAPFTDFRGPLAVSTVIAEALFDAGYTVRIKWPNDIALKTPEGLWAKCVGSLLERKGELLVAGIGINVVTHPPVSELRDGAALPAGSLAQCGTPPSASELWETIVRRFQTFDAPAFLSRWPTSGETQLLWLHERVVLTRRTESVTGTFLGLGPVGELRLQTQDGTASFTDGSLRLSD